MTAFLLLGSALFCIGIYGVIGRRNLIAILIAIELMLNGVMVNFMAFNRFVAPDPAVGQIFTIFIIGVAAAEAAIALSIVLVLYRRMGSIDIEEADRLKG